MGKRVTKTYNNSEVFGKVPRTSYQHHKFWEEKAQRQGEASEKYGQGRREVGGGPGQNFFLGAPISKFFSEENFFGQQTPPPPSPVDNILGKTFFRTSTLQLLSRDFISIFHTKFRYLAQKTDILSFARKYLTHKNDWGPTKNFQGPPAPRDPG
jgi:hypothetical protein